MKNTENFVSRYWNGNYTLGISYWLIFMFLTYAVAVMAVMAYYSVAEASSNVQIVGVMFFALLTCGIMLTVWELVGLWRSASKHVGKGGRQFWANLVKVIVVIAAASSLMRLVSVLPMVPENYALLTYSGTGFPKFKTRILRDGKALEVSGGISKGVTSNVRQMLRENPSIAILHLNNKGGSISEAMSMVLTS